MKCVDKISYPSKKAAKIVAKKRRRIVGYPLYVYRCKICRTWHLTKITKKQKKARKNKYKNK